MPREPVLVTEKAIGVTTGMDGTEVSLQRLAPSPAQAHFIWANSRSLRFMAQSYDRLEALWSDVEVGR